MSNDKKSEIEFGSGDVLPLLPLRDIVVFPHMIVPLFVGREKSIAALEEVMNNDRQVLLFTQKNASDDDPSPESLYEVGTVASVLQLLKLPDGTVKVLVEGVSRARVRKFTEREDYFEAVADIIEDSDDDPVEIEALARSVVADFENYVKLNKKVSPEVVSSVTQIDEYSKLADTIASHLAVKISEKQDILGIFSVRERLEHVIGMMESEISVLQVEKRIRGRVKRQMEKTQREYYLNEQMKAIQKELGEGEDGKDELQELEDRITDLKKAEEILDSDHYGLDKVKERIIEYLAVQTRAKKLKGPILCLVGPPGVGKTSLGKSLAKSTGREYIRMALGGVRDESEIRGHRRTYIGSMPGKIIQSMKKAKKANPLFLLDEIDKMGMDFRGDPSSALLEVLDPEQNSTFADHYLEVDYDLSNVMFVTTANTLNIPGPLMDRMEIIRIAGYTEDEKLEIAKRHLLPKSIKDHALEPKEFSVNDDAVRAVIQTYTREAGVRNLERELSKLARKAVTEIMKGNKKSIKVTPKNLDEYLGVPKFRHGEAEKEDQVGVVTGLAWTEVGGELLTIEGVSMPGRGKMTVTGNLKDVMKESISAAASYVRSRAVDFGIKPPTFDQVDIHVHVPEGATPKDGPSAGVGMTTSIVSIMTGIPIKANVAMTGEITLRGRVLPIGGLKEKLLAALRGGITKVLIPEENAKDLADIPDNVKNEMEIIPVSRIDEVLEHALVSQPVPIEWTLEDAERARREMLAPQAGQSASIAH